MIKPIAFFDPHKGFYWAKPTKITAPVTVDVEPLALYTQRTWVGLTDEEIKRMGKLDLDSNYFGIWYDFAKAIEAKLRSKNDRND
jgi:hypothetical protein